MSTSVIPLDVIDIPTKDNLDNQKNTNGFKSDANTRMFETASVGDVPCKLKCLVLFFFFHLLGFMQRDGRGE